MDYIFGYVNRDSGTVENLKTVGETHTNLEGFVEVVRNYFDCTITDRFQVREKYQSAEDAEGNAYDWYTISNHYRYIDKYTPHSNRLMEAAEVSKIAFVSLAEAGNIPAETALEHVELFAPWAEKDKCQEGGIRLYDGKLYKCRQSHTAQAGWEPDKTPNLWAVIDVSHAGTAEDPIPASRGMDYEYGKYYLDPEDGKTYLCRRGDETGTINLQYLPHEVVGNYFDEVI